MKCGIAKIATLLLLSVTSCYSYKNLSSQPEFEEYAQYESVWILDATTHSGDTLRFHEKSPGKITGSEVTGLLSIWIPAIQTDSLVFKPKSVEPKSFWLNGSHYKIIEIDKANLIFFDRDSLKIPLNNVKSMHVKKFDRSKTRFAMVAGITTGAIGLLVLVVVSYANQVF